jgi:Zn-dependent oligopeptidase
VVVNGVQRVIELGLRSAKLSGVGLEGDVKERFNKLKLRAAELVGSSLWTFGS